MSPLRRLMMICFCALSVAGCADAIDREVPPEGAVFSVSDFHLFSDGRHLAVLSSNFNRAYDYGRVSVMDTETKKVVSSVLVGSLGGKMAVTADERTIYAATRERGLLHRMRMMSDPTGAPWLSYGGDGTLGGATVSVQTEPYALALGENDTMLLVGHMLNGEIAIFSRDGDTDLPVGTFFMERGITAVVADPAIDAYLIAYKNADHLGLLRVNSTAAGHYGVTVSRLDLPLPVPGVDVRHIVASTGAAGDYYLSYRNGDLDGYETPTALKVSVEQDGQGVFLRRHWAAALSAAPGEAAVVRCSAATGIEEVFIAIPGNKALSVLDGASGLLIASIDLGKCTPYQVYHRDDDPRRRVFVGCFKEDKVLAIDADCTADIRYTVGEVTQ